MSDEIERGFFRPFVIGAIVGGVAIAVCANLLTGDPFYFNGQPVGFLGKVKELDRAFKTKAKEVDDLKQELSGTKVELSKLRLENSKFIEEKNEAERIASDIWSPVDTVRFFIRDGEFSGNKVEGKGRWSSTDRELSFKLISLDDEEAVFETGLAEPYNQMRFVRNANYTSNGYTWASEKWKYSVEARFSYPSSSVVLKINRQKKKLPA